MNLEEGEERGEADILQIINNVNRKYTVGRGQFLMLIKRQKEKDYCTLYITDCEAKFWIKKMDLAFIESIKESMSIKTELRVLAGHFARSLRENSILVLEHDVIKVEIQIKIGEGLTMSCNFNVDSSIEASQSPHDFKMVLRNFMKQMYEAKESQIEEERKKWQKLTEDDRKRVATGDKADPVYVKEVLNGMKKNAQELKPKNRSLMNPAQKRRRNFAVKFQGDL